MATIVYSNYYNQWYHLIQVLKCFCTRQVCMLIVNRRHDRNNIWNRSLVEYKIISVTSITVVVRENVAFNNSLVLINIVKIG